MTFHNYLKKRGYNSINQTLLRMIPNSLIQPGFHLVWRVWNPFCGYLLFLFYLRLGHRKNIAAMITFITSGFLFHDLLIFMVFGIVSFVFTISFLFYSVVYISMGSNHYNTIRFYQRSKITTVFLNLSIVIAGLLIGFFFNCFIFPNSPISKLIHINKL
jgi:hypothetical protein